MIEHNLQGRQTVPYKLMRRLNGSIRDIANIFVVGIERGKTIVGIYGTIIM